MKEQHIDVKENQSIMITVLPRVQSTVQIFIDGKTDTCLIGVELQEESQLAVLTLEKSSGKTLRIQQRSRLATGASIQWHNTSLGHAQLTHDLVSTMHGDHATSNIDWIFYAKEQESQSINVRNIFNGRDGGGEITIKGVAEQKAHVKCLGLIEIGEQGGGTDTYLTEDVLMLDRSAKVDAIPALEIRTNDVKASHSATVSRVTEEDLFYFNARGIEEKEARQMYIEGYLGQLTERISNEKIRDVTMNAIQEKFLL